LSPTRPARKRPATEEDLPFQRPGGSKKLKGKPLSRGNEAKHGPTISAGSSSQFVLQPSTQKNNEHARAPVSRDSRCPTSNFPSARTKYKPKSQRHGPSTSLHHGFQTISKEKGKVAQEQEGVSTGRSIPSQSIALGTSRLHFGAGRVDRKKTEPTMVARSVSSLEKTVRD